MQNMNISLPDQLKQFVDGQIDEGRYSNVSEYICELIRADTKGNARDRLEALLIEGLDTDESVLTEEDWDVIRIDAIATIQANQKRS